MSAASIHCSPSDWHKERMTDPVDGLIDLTIHTLLSSMGNYEFGVTDVPFFVADLGQAICQHRRCCGTRPKLTIGAPAVKCNPDPTLLRLLAELGTVDPSRIIFANPCKSASSLLFAARAGVTLTTFDNLDGLETIQTFLPTARLMLRIYACDNDALIKLGEKFGAPVERSFVMLQPARELGSEVCEVSFHVGASNASAYANAIQHAHMVFELGKSVGYVMNPLDIGGGYQDSNFEKISRSVREALMEGFPFQTRSIAESGRYFARSAFTLACKVLSSRCDIAEAAQERPDILYQNDGVYGSFMNVLLEKEVLTIHLGDTKRARGPHRYSIWGPTRDSVDCVARETTLEAEVRAATEIPPTRLGRSYMRAYIWSILSA
ncbi:ornithine decarboxylase [Aspergillus novofumigatus IBT 16806]|uniref:Ornithine decarboxylase n=1 Tax=Aspergillus novofumigatus (strain IBT 16806) TaxID=1392255 RepID=A0A2I1C3U5_ASPN1|nr:ornithine decarboxylase [Aspergillus novofumigatus IBT 16806]PKX92310.1 ornithine decarboxylase [Aspergillus novofumigatus IBT 16806]